MAKGTSLNPQQLHARAEALEECAEHLGLDWTEDPTERAEGNQLADRLRSEARMWRDRAQRMTSWPGEDVSVENSKTESHPGR